MAQQSKQDSPKLASSPPPGPWTVEGIPAAAHADQELSIAPESKFWIVEQRVGKVLALVGNVGHARLMAATPEMLEALDSLIQQISIREDQHGERFAPEILHACAVGEAAIRKAKGEL